MSVFDIEKESLNNLKPDEAIKLLIDSFYKSQASTIKARREEAGLETDEETIKASVKKAIDRAFDKIGSTTENPKPEDILKVFDFIEDQAKNW